MSLYIVGIIYFVLRILEPNKSTLPNIDTDKSAAMSFTWIALNTFLLLNAFVKCGSFLRIYNQWGTLVILIL